MNINLRSVLKSFGLSVLSFFLVVGVLYAATTIGASVATLNLTVTGDTALVNATSTGYVTVGTAPTGAGFAAGDFNVQTNTVLGGTLGVTGVTTLTGNTILTTASSTGLISVNSLKVAKIAADSSNTIAGLNFGYCTAPAITVAASSTGMLSCAGATGVVSGDRVFVQATSSLPANFTVQTASTTAAGVIQINVFNSGWNNAAVGNTSTGINSLNFWAVR